MPLTPHQAPALYGQHWQVAAPTPAQSAEAGNMMNWVQSQDPGSHVSHRYNPRTNTLVVTYQPPNGGLVHLHHHPGTPPVAGHATITHANGTTTNAPRMPANHVAHWHRLAAGVPTPHTHVDANHYLN